MVMMYSFCGHILYDHHSQAIDLQEEIHLADHQNSDNPIDGAGKLKDFVSMPQNVSVLVVLGIMSCLSLFTAFTRRRMLLTAVFYQGNYLNHSLK